MQYILLYFQVIGSTATLEGAVAACLLKYGDKEGKFSFLYPSFRMTLGTKKCAMSRAVKCFNCLTHVCMAQICKLSKISVPLDEK